MTYILVITNIDVYLRHNIIDMTKVELFESELQDTAQLFKALSNPARLAILNYLAQTKVCMSGDISEELPLSRTTVNQHLKELKNVGIIHGTISGVKVNYCLNPMRVNQAINTLNNFFGGSCWRKIYNLQRFNIHLHVSFYKRFISFGLFLRKPNSKFTLD